MQTWKHYLPLCAAVIFTYVLIGCGGSSGTSSVTAPSFAGTPETVAQEGNSYTYTLAASSSDGSTVSFTLTSYSVDFAGVESDNKWGEPVHGNHIEFAEVDTKLDKANDGYANRLQRSDSTAANIRGNRRHRWIFRSHAYREVLVHSANLAHHST